MPVFGTLDAARSCKYLLGTVDYDDTNGYNGLLGKMHKNRRVNKRMESGEITFLSNFYSFSLWV